jgi:hypothetical protein
MSEDRMISTLRLPMAAERSHVRPSLSREPSGYISSRSGDRPDPLPWPIVRLFNTCVKLSSHRFCGGCVLTQHEETA